MIIYVTTVILLLFQKQKLESVQLNVELHLNCSMLFASNFKLHEKERMRERKTDRKETSVGE